MLSLGAPLTSVRGNASGEPDGCLYEVVVRVLEVDPLDGDIPDKASVRLAHEEVVEGASVLLAVGALEGVPAAEVGGLK